MKKLRSGSCLVKTLGEEQRLLIIVFPKIRHFQDFGVWRVYGDLTLALH